jgi:hypothetical protein
LKACYPSGALLSSTNSHTHIATGSQLLYSIELLQEIIQLIVPYYMLQLYFIEAATGCRSMMFHPALYLTADKLSATYHSQAWDMTPSRK